MTFISAAGGSGFNCDGAGSVVGCTGGILAAGGTVTITIFAQVTGCVTPLINTAIVNPNQTIAESNFANNTATSTTTVTGCPTATPGTPTPGPATNTPTITQTPIGANLSISKISTPVAVNAGQSFSYIVTVSNSAPAISGFVTIEDSLPAGVTFLSAADVNPGTLSDTPPTTPFTCGQASGIVVCSGAQVPANGSRQVRITVLADNPCVVTSPITNRVTLNPSGYTEPGGGQTTTTSGPTATASTVINDCAQATATGTATRTITLTRTITNTPTSTATPSPTNTPSVDLVISKSASSTLGAGVASPGGTLSYTLVVQNNGTVAASNVSVVDTLDAQVTFISASGDDFQDCNHSGGTPDIVGCTGGTIGPNGGAAVITILVTASPTCGIISNTATVNPNQTVAESNYANNTATIATSCGGSPTATATSTVTQTATATPTNTGTATPITGVSLIKVSSPATVNPGGTITWTITITNNTGATLSGIEVRDNIPGFGPAGAKLIGASPTTIVSATGNSGFLCSETGSNTDANTNPLDATNTDVLCVGGTIAAGATGTISITQTIDPAITCATQGGIFPNTAQITSPSVANNTATAVSTLTGCNTPTPTATASPTGTALPNLVVTKDDPLNPGVTSQSVDTSDGAGPATWRLTVTNSGNATTGSNNVRLTDVMDNGFTFVSFTNVTGTWTCTGVGTNTATCTLSGALVSGASASVDILASVAPTVTYGNHTDTVTATRVSGNQLLPGGHTATAITTVYPWDLQVSMFDTPDP
jgi:uncharacterized repeat protein (TIGR01451 family)